MSKLTEMAREAGLPIRTVRARLARGWTWSDAFATPLGTRMMAGNIIEHNGRSMCIADWAKEIGIDPSTLSRRLNKLSPAEALTWQPNRRFARRLKQDHKRKMRSRLEAIASGSAVQRPRRKPIDTQAVARKQLRALYAMREREQTMAPA